jgi:hypothetical protein
MRRSSGKKVVIGGVVIAAAAALWLGFGSGAAAKPRAARQQGGCQLAQPQPGEPLELNSVGVGQVLVKTVAMQKEVFDCTVLNQPAGTGTHPQVRDLETFIEIVELRKGNQIVPVGKSVESALCIKDFPFPAQGGSASCRAQAVPLGGPDPTPFQGCVPLPAQNQPFAPVRMNTVAIDAITKTVKVEKEVLDCSHRFNALVLGDVYLFTEIVEGISRTSQGLPTLVPISKTFEGIICFKDVQEVQLKACELFPTQ